MFEFGDELVLGSFKIPWLIWIQLLITFLLIFLLYYFSFIALDLPFSSDDSDVIIPSSSTSTITTTRFLHHDKVGESRSIRGEIVASPSRRIIRGSSDHQQRSIGNISSSKDNNDDDDDATHFARSENPYHPCYYFELAKQAFLKCFGLDIASECSSTIERNKKD